MVTMRTQAVHEAPVVAQDIPVVYLPGPAPAVSARLLAPQLIEASYEAARTFLASSDHRRPRIACDVIHRVRPRYDAGDA